MHTYITLFTPANANEKETKVLEQKHLLKVLIVFKSLTKSKLSVDGILIYLATRRLANQRS